MFRRTRQDSRNEITEGSVLRALGVLTAPMLISGMLQNAQSLIDLFWVGRLGPHSIAAVAISGTILMILFPVLMGLATGTIALVARAVGADRYDDASAAASQSLMLAVVLGVLCGILGWFAADPLLRLLGAEPEVIAAGSGYLKIMLLGTFTVFVLFTGNSALQGAGDATTPMYLMLVSNVLNIVLDPLFIFGLGPFPRLGVAGAAWATILSQAIVAIMSIHVLVSGRTRLHLHARQWVPNPGLSWRILRIGIPGSGQMLSRSLMSAVMMAIVASCGTAAVAAYGTGLRFHMIILMPAFALGGAAATMVGQNLGAGQPQRAHHVAWTASIAAAVILGAAAGLLFVFARPLIRLFNTDAQVVDIGTHYLRIVSPFYLFAAVGIVLARAMNGAGDSLSPMVITIVTLWGLQVPLAILFSRLWQPATVGIWWAIVVAFVVQAVLTAAWFETGRWKRARV